MTADRPVTGMGRAALVVTAFLSVLVAWATPAWASHAVEWGIDRPDGPRQIETDGPVGFVAAVTQDGRPLAGWPMTARVMDDNGEVVDELGFTTDDQGLGRFTVPAGGTRVIELCDDDGCLYGEAVMYPVGNAPTAPASEEPEDPTETPGGTPTVSRSDPTSEPDEAPTADGTATEQAADATADDGPTDEATLVAEELGDEGGSALAAWVAVFVILTATAGGAVAWRQRST